MRQRLLLFGVIAALIQPSALFAEPVYDAHVNVDLVTDVDSVQSGVPFRVGIDMEMDEGWHVYWKNPGDSGLPTMISWGLPKGFVAGEIQWPFPERMDYPELTSYVYEGEVLLLSELTPPRGLTPEGDVEIAIHLEWLSCGTMCLPGKADLTLTLPISEEEPFVDEATREWFEAVMADWPLATDTWRVTAQAQQQAYVLRFEPLEPGAKRLSGVAFFPENSEVIDHRAEQVFEQTDDGYQLTVMRSNIAREDVPRLKGVLVAEEPWQDDRHALMVDVPVERSSTEQSITEKENI